jgi:hypothetical protein
VGDYGLVATDESRSWADYMVAITLAIQYNVKAQREVFTRLDSETGSIGLTHVRLLDIVAWTSRGKPRRETTDGTCTPSRRSARDPFHG